MIQAVLRQGCHISIDLSQSLHDQMEVESRQLPVGTPFHAGAP